MSVTIVTDSKTGSKIRYYASNPEFAYCVMQSDKIVHRPGGFIDKQTRTTILRAKKDILTMFVSSYANSPVPGQIVVREFTESDCPDTFKSRIRQDVDYEDAVQPFLKRPQDDAPYLRKEGDRILRFTDYDPDNIMQDIRVEHDNQEEIAAWRKAVAARPASFES